MNTKFLLPFLSLMLFFSVKAENVSLPYSANWQYAEGGLEKDGANVGTPNSDSDNYDLQGWVFAVTTGTRPFYMAYSASAGVLANTLEFSDAQQDPEQTSWIISPALNFSNKTDKIVSFKCGLEKADYRSSNLTLLYSTDFDGDASSATWVEVKNHLIPDAQVGLGDSKLQTISLTIPVIAEKGYIAIRAEKDENKTAGASQAKIRVTKFVVTEVEKAEVESIPYKAKWFYKDEILNADSTFNTSLDADAGTAKGDHQYYDLNGWELVNTEGTRGFFLTKGGDPKKAIDNTLEFTDNKQNTTETAWAVSPYLDFSGDQAKYVSFSCGKEFENQKTSNLDLLYSIDYKGDVSTATWTVVDTKINPSSQDGMVDSVMTHYEKEISLNASKVVFGIRAIKDGAYISGAKQAKFRVKNFEVNLTTGIQDQPIQESKKVFFANPVLETLFLTDAFSVSTLEIFTLTGQNALTLQNPTESVSVSNLSKGSYIVCLTLKNGKKESAMMIKK